VIEPGQLDPRAFMREFRRTYVNFFTLWTRVERAVPAGVQLSTPAERPITDADLPDDLRALVATFRDQRRLRIAWVKFMRTVNGRPAQVVEDERPLPGEERLISVSRTLTLATGEELRVVTELFVGEIEAPPVAQREEAGHA
jgi:hypothetical protein